MASDPDMHTQRVKMRARSREEAEAIFRLAGFELLHVWEMANGYYVWEMANGYWPDAPDYDEVRAPWWLIMTQIGAVQIGWRKRVMHIQWDHCAFRGAVTEDDVTKNETYVHAGSVEKAIEYLRALRVRTAAASGTAATPAAAPPERSDPPNAQRLGHMDGCASTQGRDGDGCDCGWTR